jgi:hypothetical protein
LEDFQTWDYFLQLLKYQDFRSISIRIKEILLYFTTCSIIISLQHTYFKASYADVSQETSTLIIKSALSYTVCQ